MYTPNCDVFWPGSYPFKEPSPAIRRILKAQNFLLHWPQLPRRSKKERLLDQTYRAMFGGRRGKPKGEAAEHDQSPSAFTKGTAAGWSAIWRMVSKRKDEYFKSQLTGPITLTSKLQTGVIGGKATVRKKQRLIRYMSLWLDHAYWQIDAIKRHGFEPIIVLDEPLLPTYMGPSGSPTARKVLRLLKSTVKRLKARGAIVGIHCCNRISPATLVSVEPDLIHFDAYHFATQTAQSRESLQQYLRDGGIVAWGVIPTGDALTSNRRSQLEKILNNLLAAMETRGLPLRKVLAQSMVAPTCGTGSLTPRDSDDIMNFASSLSRQLKSRYKL